MRGSCPSRRIIYGRGVPPIFLVKLLSKAKRLDGVAEPATAVFTLKPV